MNLELDKNIEASNMDQKNLKIYFATTLANFNN